MEPLGAPGLVAFVDVATKSEANERSFFGALGRKKKQDAALLATLEGAIAMQPVHVAGPWCVRFTRLSLTSVRLDDDNLAGAFKRLRDQLSKVLGIDDRSPCIAFAYAQEQNIQAGVRLEIWGPGSLPR